MVSIARGVKVRLGEIFHPPIGNGSGAGRRLRRVRTVATRCSSITLLSPSRTFCTTMRVSPGVVRDGLHITKSCPQLARAGTRACSRTCVPESSLPTSTATQSCRASHSP